MSQIGDRSSASPRPPGQERRATLGALGSLPAPAHAPAQRPLSGHAAAPHQLPPHLQVPQPAQLQLFGGFFGLALLQSSLRIANTHTTLNTSKNRSCGSLYADPHLTSSRH